MKLLIAGDFCPRYRVEKAFEDGCFESVLKEVIPIVKEADYSIVNFECPIGHGGEEPITKCGPNLRCGLSGVKAIKYAGFNCVTLANNHFFDYGQAGVENTLTSCHSECIDTVGGGRTIADASKTLYKIMGDETIAVINCCEHEYSIATETIGGSNPLNPIKQFYAIREARERADYVLVIVHGGHEHYQLPSMRMQQIYRFFIDVGADAVVNHHQHCYSGYEIYKGKPIFYGLGNFCFDKPAKTNDEKWTQGYLVEIEFKSEGVLYDIIPYQQCSDRPEVNLLPKEVFKVRLDELNEIIGNEERLREENESYYNNSDNDIYYLLRPIRNHFIQALQNRNLFPKFMPMEWLHQLRDYITCESHRDKLVHFFINTDILKKSKRKEIHRSDLVL